MADYVRPLTQKDIELLIPRIQADRKLTDDELRDRVGAARAALVYDDGRVKGCATIAEPRRETDGMTARAWLFTDPNERCRGIGGELWRSTRDRLDAMGVDTVVVGYRSDNSCARAFYAKRRFVRWFSSTLLAYSGPGFSPMSLRARHYEDSDAESVIAMENEGFYELRKENQLRPYMCYPDGAARDKRIRKSLFDDRDNLFLFFDAADELVGFARVEDYIDLVVVRPRYRRKGYGRQLTMFSVNVCRQRGADTVYLGVMDTNTGARALYDSLGFGFVETNEVARSRRPRTQ